jgi:hypothetical protein
MTIVASGIGPVLVTVTFDVGVRPITLPVGSRTTKAKSYVPGWLGVNTVTARLTVIPLLIG